MNLSAKLDSKLRIFVWHPYTTTATIVLNTIKSTPHKKKQNTAKDQVRQTEDEMIQPQCRFIKTHSDLGRLLYLPKETLYMPITVLEMIPKTGKVGSI